MNYLVIEKFPEPSILSDKDGHPMIFDDIDEAFGSALSECQDGMVVNITTGTHER